MIFFCRLFSYNTTGKDESLTPNAIHTDWPRMSHWTSMVIAEILHVPQLWDVSSYRKLCT